VLQQVVEQHPVLAQETQFSLRYGIWMQRFRIVRYPLMGGQACVSCGAAEFSRDTGIVILSDHT
jgi:hypothetical protein